MRECLPSATGPKFTSSLEVPEQVMSSLEKLKPKSDKCKQAGKKKSYYLKPWTTAVKAVRPKLGLSVKIFIKKCTLTIAEPIASKTVLCPKILESG